MPTVDDIHKTSRYLQSDQHLDAVVSPGTLRWGLWQKPDINMSDYDTYVVKDLDQKRLDYIAYLAYGESRLWWAIALVNNIANPLDTIPVGTVLRLPLMSAILESLVPARSKV